ncbi:hypothetical protein VOLCADRAFT_102995 [Volvox carteri f. nagariensis]|uniref:Transmembrane protein 231 n=1 Tax=Volvox carteri f. nagariensis TaxID=3068 RepID=D8TJ86_VOLCA|nr:uncharacterized protein VOLCADRAFT_102995 [Volvox carteri f. nagariensis]EFJ52331.1 hypothetical protein VOLCADRAFT_102995 [Volvox carteri f. nagariensis]|eukprot:XP_002946404.1 hypothetical protein VOLCADRAFT_102995 [Volvox carteri f. nagariensis]
MVQVYREPLCRRYYGNFIGEAMWFRVVAYLAAIVLAAVIAYATGGAWVRLKPTNVQATVHYTQDALLVFEGQQSGQVLVWSTSETTNSVFSNNFTPASVQVVEEDLNNDGKPDTIDFWASVASNFPIHSVKALLQFNYSLTGSLQLDMSCLAYLTHSSSIQGSTLFTDGELVLQAKNQIRDRRFNSVYNVPILNSTAPNVQTAVQGGTRKGFELRMRIRIPANQIIYYRPQTIEMLKFAWIQWLATFIVLWYLLQWVEWFVFSFHLVETRIVSDFQPRKQRF